MLGQSATLLAPFDSAAIKAIPDEITVIDTDSLLGPGMDPKKVILLSTSLEPKDVVDHTIKKGIRHVIQTGHGDVEREFLIASSMILSKQDFLKNPLSVFNINGKQLSLSFNTIAQKEEVKQKIFDHIQPMPPLRTLADAVLLIADEMIMNAMFDAPGNVNRDKAVLPDGKQAEIIVAYDQKKLAVICQDPFGSIEDSKLMNRLKACYETDQITDINFGPGGAGIGCRMMFENSVAMYFAAQKNIKTVTSCILPVDQGLRATLRMPKNLHVAI